MDNKNNTNIQREQLKNLRKIYGYTQEKMAEEIGISESLYKKNETGILPVSPKTARAIEKRFGVSGSSIHQGVFRDGTDAWTQVLECDDVDKMTIMLRLLRYFFSDGKYNESSSIIKALLDTTEE